MLKQILNHQGLDELKHRLNQTPSHSSIKDQQLIEDQQLVETVEAYIQENPDAFHFDAKGFATLKTPSGTWKAGHFSTPSLGELKQKLSLNNPSENGHISLNVMCGTGPLNDIVALQGEGESDALYQLASQFNCLEATGPRIASVASYFDDPTQGPFGAISAFPGALLRHYSAPHQDGSRFCQTSKREINLLGDAVPSEIARVQAGYLMSQNIVDPQAFEDALITNFDKIQIGLHQDIEVVFGAGWKPVNSDQTLISQAMTSTLAGGGYSYDNTDTPVYRAIQRQLLRAAYLGILLGALTTGKKRVLLTAIGGGVFGNPHQLIWESILWAMSEIESLSSQNLDVILNLREFNVSPDVLERDCEARNGKLIFLD